MPDQNKSVSKLSINGVLWTLSGTSFQTMIQLIVTSLLARLLSPNDFGIVGIIMIMVSFTYMFTQLGVGASLIQIQNISDKHVAVGYSLSIIIGIVICAIFYLIAPLASELFNIAGLEMPIKFFSLFFPIKSFNSVTEAMLQKKLKFSEMVMCNSISYFIGFGITSLILAMLGFGYWAIIIGQFAQLLIYTGLLLFYEHPMFAFVFDYRILKQLLFFGSGHTLATFFNFIAENADNMIVGKVLGAKNLGIYSRSFQLFSIPARFFGSIFDRVLFPVLATKQDEIKTLRSFYLFSISFCIVVLFPISLLLVINAKIVISVLLGDQWTESVYIFQILIIGLAFRFGTKINKSYIKSLGLVYKGAYYQFIFASLIVGLCLIGGMVSGLPGIAYGVLVATLLNYLQISIRLQKILLFPSSKFIHIHFGILIISAPVIGMAMLISYFNISVYAHLVLSIALYVPLFIIIIYWKLDIFYSTTELLIFEKIANNLPSGINKYIKKIGNLFSTI